MTSKICKQGEQKCPVYKSQAEKINKSWETPIVETCKSCNICVRQSLNGMSERKGRNSEKSNQEFSQLAEKNYKLQIKEAL